MQHTYNVTGMTCGGCIAKVKSQLQKLGDVTQAEVQLTLPNATIHMENHISLDILQDALSKAGNFVISESHVSKADTSDANQDASSLPLVKPQSY